MKEMFVIGIGAGNYEGMTIAAVKALEAAEVIVGYTVYCDLLKPHFPEKEFLATPMMRETERCRLALECAQSGKAVAMVCSGDAGIYGMASPLLEMAQGSDVRVQVIPGVTAACSGAALLGAPLSCDFAVISLSDLLTPAEQIADRLEKIAAADLCLVLYNPASKKRKTHLQRACDILLRYRSEQTVCAVTRNIGRAGESRQLMTLKALRDWDADMFTTVFIGNSATREIDGNMVTPRGYRYEA